jgi:hypothetical protein
LSYVPREFKIAKNRSTAQEKPLRLPSRYHIIVNIAANGTDNAMRFRGRAGDCILFQYHACTQLLAVNYRNGVIHLDNSSNIILYFTFE